MHYRRFKLLSISPVCQRRHPPNLNPYLVETQNDQNSCPSAILHQNLTQLLFQHHPTRTADHDTNLPPRPRTSPHHESPPSQHKPNIPKQCPNESPNQSPPPSTPRTPPRAPKSAHSPPPPPPQPTSPTSSPSPMPPSRSPTAPAAAARPPSLPRPRKSSRMCRDLARAREAGSSMCIRQVGGGSLRG